MFFAPCVPLFFQGEEFNNPYVEAPRKHDDGTIYAHTCNQNVPGGHVDWLYSSVMQWEQQDTRFLASFAKAAAIRAGEPLLHYFANTTADANVLVVSNYSTNATQVPPSALAAPYLRIWPRGQRAESQMEAILIVGNDQAQPLQLTVALPMAAAGFPAAGSTVVTLTDLFNGQRLQRTRGALSAGLVLDVAADDVQAWKLSV